jgi:uroporphyrinogen decarboxylase
MNHRERVLATLGFRKADRVPYDLMEGTVWPELMDYFRQAHGLTEPGEVLDFLDTDFRWIGVVYCGPQERPPAEGLPEGWRTTYTDALFERPLLHAQTVAEVEAHQWPDPNWWKPDDYAAFRRRWPDHAIVLFSGWKPLFCAACNEFGMEGALVRMAAQPDVFDAFVRRQHAFCMAYYERALRAAKGYCDLCWLGDDYAGNDSMLMSPALWRRHVKPYLAEQVRLVHDCGLRVLFHSCGAVRAILPDLAEIGVDAHLVFQTTARGMDPQSIARDFGGRMAFYGGIDCQHLLTFGTPGQVRAQVRANVEAFADCGGYVVSNAHCHIANIRGDNIVAMCDEARRCMP